MSRKALLPLVVAAGLSLLTSCDGISLGTGLAFEVDCTEPACGWQVQQGAVQRTGSWHPKDLAFSLVGNPARISRTLSVTQNPSCLHFSYVGDVEASTQTKLLLDFNDDGVDDVEALLPVSSWTHQTLSLGAPADYGKLRISLQKTGDGAAKLTQFGMRGDSLCGGGVNATRLQNGAACALDATCSSQRCVLGHCSACGVGGCVEGEACRDSGECIDGACAAQVCRSCARAGTCGAAEGCSAPGQCAAESCVAGSVPSMTTTPTLDATCGECGASSDCGGKPCVLGRCAACELDGDCTSGQVCRWLDPFDALSRGCVPRPTSPLPRGALCENDSECEGSLPCSAGEGRAKRCGIACGKEGDCSADHVCSAPGARKVSDSPERFATLPHWSQLAGRIATCWPRVNYQAPCEIHQQCTGILFSKGACCRGLCTDAQADYATGECPDYDMDL